MKKVYYLGFIAALLTACSTPVDEPETQTPTTAEENNLTSNSNSAEQTDENVEDEVSSEVAENDDLHYLNKYYGFTLEFPDTWKGYILTLKDIEWGENGTTDSIYFGFKDQPELLNIAIFEKQQWEDLSAEGGPKPDFLGERSGYIFAGSLSQDAVNEAMTSRLAEGNEILDSFQVVE